MLLVGHGPNLKESDALPDYLEGYVKIAEVASKKVSIPYWKILRPNFGSLPMIEVAVHEKCYWNGNLQNLGISDMSYHKLAGINEIVTTALPKCWIIPLKEYLGSTKTIL